DEHEGIDLPAVRLPEPLHELVTDLVVDQEPVHRHPRQARERSQHDVLDAGLHRGGEGDGVTVAAEPRVQPQDVDERSFFRRHVRSPPLRRTALDGVPTASRRAASRSTALHYPYRKNPERAMQNRGYFVAPARPERPAGEGKPRRPATVRRDR